MHAGVRPDMPGTFDDINRTATREITAWDDTKTMMIKAQIVPAFCTLPEAVEAAVAELQRISAALQASAPPGEHVTRESSINSRRCSRSASRLCSSPRDRSGSAGSRSGPRPRKAVTSR